jgi:hypothetical protein
MQISEPSQPRPKGRYSEDPDMQSTETKHGLRCGRASSRVSIFPILLVCLLNSLHSTCRAQTCYPAPDGLVGWWPGEGSADDLIGTNNGVLKGGTLANGSGFVGSAFTFDGTNGYVQIPDSPLFRPANLTVEAWVRFDSLDSAGNSPAGDQYIFFKQNSRDTDFEGFELGKGRNSELDYFYVIVTSATAQSVALQSVTSISPGVWYHIAGVRGSNFTQIYVNGQLENQTNVNFPQDYGTLPVYLGTSGQSYWDHKLSGSLDEVSLYSRALSAPEIANIFKAGSAGKCRPIRITAQPQDQTVFAGSNAIFSVTASSDEPLAYAWQLNGATLTGSTDSTLVLTNAQLTDAGSYSVVISKSSLAVTSAPAVLTVLASAAIIGQPQSLTNLLGSLATFTATATGTAPLACQWRFNDVALTNNAHLSGVNSNQLQIASVQPSDEGSYTIVVTNMLGAVTSVVATLTVGTPASVNASPLGLSVVSGSNVSLSITASGTDPLVYQWRQNGVNLFDGGKVAGVNSPTLTLTNVGLENAGMYDALVTNSFGASTSTLAFLEVTLLPQSPLIISQPGSRAAFIGDDVTFQVSASGTSPLTFQWRKDGTDLAGATGAALSLSKVQVTNAGNYQVVVANNFGSATSQAATLQLKVQQVFRADALVLVNSASARYSDFQRYVQPYLDNFGLPYAVQDIATNAVGSVAGTYAAIIVGHRQLDTNHLYLDDAGQAAITAAVSGGAGLVNFDSDLWTADGAPRYQFLQDIFGFSFRAPATVTNVSFPPTEPGSQMHYISSLHATNEVVTFSNSMSMNGLVLGSNDTAIALAGGRPLVAITKFGQGRAVQWSSYDWVSTAIQGPLNGLDDILWRGMVWAARKPFVLRGLPNFVAMRVDDVEGPFWWVHIANEVGFKPYLALFIANVSPTNIDDLRSLVTNGNATAGIHSLTASTLFYFDHANETNYSDLVMSNIFNFGSLWFQTSGIPISKCVIPHYSEIGPNAFAGLHNLGVEFLAIEVVPGTVEYGPNPAPWMKAGPYRNFDTPGRGESNLPLFYADFLQVPGHPELDGQFFDRYTEIRNCSDPGQYECGEWCISNNDIPSSINRATRQIKRALDSMVLASLFTHEWWIHPTTCCGSTMVTPDNWRFILQSITNNLAAYQPIYVTTDYADQYVRATRTSRLLSATYDITTAQITGTFSGHTDLETTIQVFTGEDASITRTFGTVPVFSNGLTSAVATLGIPPSIVIPPMDTTVNRGTMASFSVTAAGAAPMTFQWLKDGTNILTDDNKVNGSSTTTLTLTRIQDAAAGAYSVMASNVYGSITSPPAQLTLFSTAFQQSIAFSPTLLGFSWSSVPGQTYRLQYKDDLNSSIWHNIFPDIIAGGITTTVTQPIASQPRFYRVLLVQPPTLQTVIQSIQITNTVATLTWNSTPGIPYRLQHNDGLSPTNWTDEFSDTIATAATMTATNDFGDSAQRFYRVATPIHFVPPPGNLTYKVISKHVTISWDSLPSRHYRLQYKQSLDDPSWIDTSPDIIASSSRCSSDYPIGNVPQRFFRVVLLP